MALAAEYGFYYRMPDEEEWQTMAPEVDTSWRDIVRPILEVGKEVGREGPAGGREDWSAAVCRWLSPRCDHPPHHTTRHHES